MTEVRFAPFRLPTPYRDSANAKSGSCACRTAMAGTDQEDRNQKPSMYGPSGLTHSWRHSTQSVPGLGQSVHSTQEQLISLKTSDISGVDFRSGLEGLSSRQKDFRVFKSTLSSGSKNGGPTNSEVSVVNNTLSLGATNAAKGGATPWDWGIFKNVHCRPIFKDIFLKTFQCNATERHILANLHARAYFYARTAWLTLRRMDYLDEMTRRIVWDWGKAKSPHQYLWTYNGILDKEAHRDSLAEWFGPYTYDRFTRVLLTLSALTKLFEKGVEVGGLFYWMRYKCKSDGCGENPARHLVSWTIDICPAFWNDLKVLHREDGLKRRSVTILHENFHNLLGALQPRDERLTGVCHGGWNAADNMCYRDRSWDADWTFYGLNPNDGDNPRDLIRAKQFSLALNNVDNYVSWTLRRYVSHWFGPCDLPYPLMGTGKEPL